MRLLLQSLNSDLAEPFHHVSLGPAQKDRVSLHKHTGPSPSHWLSLTYSHAMEYYLQVLPPNEGYRTDVIGLQQDIQRYSPPFPARLLVAPTRHPHYFKLHSTAQASVPHGSRKGLKVNLKLRLGQAPRMLGTEPSSAQ